MFRPRPRLHLRLAQADLDMALIGKPMSDATRFTPDAITVRRGETVRFVFRNEGKQLHEFVLDTLKAGDKVHFVVQKSDTGFVVTDIQAAK